MKLSKETKKLVEDLGLSEIDAAVMQIKSQLYIKAAKSINDSDLTHEEIASKAGTSRARITRISNMGENSISIEILLKIIVALENKIPLKVA